MPTEDQPFATSENDSTTATAEPLVRPAISPKRREKVDDKQKRKRQPPYAVIVHNDDFHTYEYVIEVLQKVCGHSLERAFELTCEVDLAGRALVWSGAKEVAELKQEQIRNHGPDFYAENTVRFPLGVTIEPLPSD